MANENNPAKYWTAAPNTVVAGPASGSAAGDLGARALVSADLTSALASAMAVVGVAAGYKIARGTQAATGTTAVNTGLATIAAVAVSIVGAISSGTCWVSWSALASTGYFSALVYAQTSSGSGTPAASGVAAVVSWIAVGT